MARFRHKITKSRGPNGGFSLVEMLIATAIFGSIAAGMATFLVRQQSAQDYIGARSQAMLTAQRVLSQVSRYYMTKKPGALTINAKKWFLNNGDAIWKEVECTYNPALANGSPKNTECRDTPVTKSQKSLAAFIGPCADRDANGKKNRNCSALSIARGMAEELNVQKSNCGCPTGVLNYDLIEIETVCDRWPSGTSPNLRGIDFRQKKDLIVGGKKVSDVTMLSCISCPVGKRPMIRIRRNPLGQKGKWQYYPDMRVSNSAGVSAKDRADKSVSFYKNAMGMEMCISEHTANDTLSVVLNTFYTRLGRQGKGSKPGKNVGHLFRLQDELQMPVNITDNPTVRFFPCTDANDVRTCTK